MRRAAVVAVAVVALALSGCARVRGSIHNLVSDATDVARFDLSFSFGTDMGAHVMATQWVQLKSYSYEDLYRVGYMPRQLGVWKEERDDWWVGPARSRNIHVSFDSVKLLWHGMLTKRPKGHAGAYGLAAESGDEVGFGAHLFVFGVSAGIRPLEIADLFTSPFGLDLGNDDSTWQQRVAMLEARKKARSAPKTPEAGDDAP